MCDLLTLLFATLTCMYDTQSDYLGSIFVCHEYF